ncbi:hypothetical protein ABZ319_23685 [Nocardia sp. NPDC005978]|uniref:hypothetical protein n=1 Tax=Nocardia sp. NPDC005978 TaxID=3156725 RepID=UPI0033A1A04B
MAPSVRALDLTTVGTRIGDRKKPLAPATMARAERCRQRFAEFPAILMPAKGAHGSERHPWQPMSTQTSQQETGLLSTGAVFAAHRHNGDGKNFSLPMDTVTSTHELAMLFAAVNNFQGAPRGVGEPLPTQAASETLGLMTGVVPYRKNTLSAISSEPMPTVTSEQIPGLLTAEWAAALADLPLEDCHFRMLGPHEVGRGCGFDTTFPGHEGEFIVWGSARDQVDGFGNAVSPAVGAWIGARLRAAIHAADVSANESAA